MSAEPALLHGRLLKKPGEFESLLDRVRRIEALDRALHQWSSEPWLQAIRVANLRGDTLVVFSDSAASLTTLRYQRDTLVTYLREHHGLPVSRIEARVKWGTARSGV